jgi:hypothetical protein
VVVREILPIIRNAKKSIDVPIFFLTHKLIAGELMQAHLRGVGVRVIIDATAATNGYTKHELLRAVGIPVKVENWGGKMHMKAAVIDERISIIGSMNWTTAGERDNDENVLIIESDRVGQQMTRFFEEIWSSIPDRWLAGQPAPESVDSPAACRDGIDNDFDEAVDSRDGGCLESASGSIRLPPFRIVPKAPNQGLIYFNGNWYCSPPDARAAGWSP